MQNNQPLTLIFLTFYAIVCLYACTIEQKIIYSGVIKMACQGCNREKNIFSVSERMEFCPYCTNLRYKTGYCIHCGDTGRLIIPVELTEIINDHDRRNKGSTG